MKYVVASMMAAEPWVGPRDQADPQLSAFTVTVAARQDKNPSVAVVHIVVKIELRLDQTSCFFLWIVIPILHVAKGQTCLLVSSDPYTVREI